MNLLGGLRTQHREQPAEGAVGGRGFGVKACEAAVDQIAAQFAIEIRRARIGVGSRRAFLIEYID
ncbi:MAG: hypothetical protein AUG46_09355 [Acidobacteria bacterium 13_1_20CM_3_58_11]|nr:MAG: hypothetical protein AUG46_09355 [Acidobacteria bacterium 13_1_20CM_3_58_11]